MKRHRAELAIAEAKEEFAQANALLGSMSTRAVIDHHMNTGGDAGGMSYAVEQANLRHALAREGLWLSDEAGRVQQTQLIEFATTKERDLFSEQAVAALREAGHVIT